LVFFFERDRTNERTKRKPLLGLLLFLSSPKRTPPREEDQEDQEEEDQEAIAQIDFPQKRERKERKERKKLD